MHRWAIIYLQKNFPGQITKIQNLKKNEQLLISIREKNQEPDSSIPEISPEFIRQESIQSRDSKIDKWLDTIRQERQKLSSTNFDAQTRQKYLEQFDISNKRVENQLKSLKRSQ